MYRPGMLRMITAEECEAILDPDAPEPWEGKVYDSARRDGDPYLNPPAVALPHSCDGWVIGGPQQVRELIEDLQRALVEMEGYDGSRG